MNITTKNIILKGRYIGKYIAKGKPKYLQAEIDVWMAESPRNKKLFEEVQDTAKISSNIEAMQQYDPISAWKLLMQEALLRQKERVLRKWKIAAVIILLVGLGGAATQFFYNQSQNSPLAMLNTTVETERGQTSKVILPDSTIVYLNSATKLVYSNNFLVENRQVKVDGEAYFKVRKDEEHPFIVTCKDVFVKVHGTEFNVNTVSDDQTVDVILDQGKIELINDKGSFSNTFLKPGERAQYNEDNHKLSVGIVDSYKYTSWRDGVLIFEDEPMKQVFKKLESWYDVDINIKDPKVYDLKFNATILDESLEDLFDLMKYTCGIDYQIIYSRNPKISSIVIVSLKEK